jgi:hypothetical protein
MVMALGETCWTKEEGYHYLPVWFESTLVCLAENFCEKNCFSVKYLTINGQHSRKLPKKKAIRINSIYLTWWRRYQENNSLKSLFFWWFLNNRKILSYWDIELLRYWVNSYCIFFFEKLNLVFLVLVLITNFHPHLCLHSLIMLEIYRVYSNCIYSRSLNEYSPMLQHQILYIGTGL